MRNFEELDADEQQIFINYLRDIGDDVNNADEYTIYDETEAIYVLKEYIQDEIDEIKTMHNSRLVKDIDEALKEFDLDDLFIEVGVGMFIKRE